MRDAALLRDSDDSLRFSPDSEQFTAMNDAHKPSDDGPELTPGAGRGRQRSLTDANGPPPVENPSPQGWAGRPPMSVRFGDPSRFFRALSDFLAPISPLRHLLGPGLVLAVGVIWFDWVDFSAHLDRINSSLAFWQTLLISILTAALFGKLAQGVVMHRHGASAEECGIKLSFGIVPRFYIAKNGISQLDFRSQRACYAATLTFRLWMFVLGALIWSITRRSGSGAADVSVVMGAVGIGSFFFIANPLLPLDGYHWMAAFLKRPRLRQDSLKVLGLLSRFRPLPEGLKRREFWLLLLYAVVSIAFTGFIVFSVLTAVLYMLEAELRGAGVVIFALMLASVGVFVLSRRQKAASRKGSRRARGTADVSTADW